MASSAGAQPKVSSPHKVAAPESRGMTASKLETAQMRAPGTPAVKAPKKAEIHKVYYNRPAGMYPGSVLIAPDGKVVQWMADDPDTFDLYFDNHILE